jgi:hypothetical protein
MIKRKWVVIHPLLLSSQRDSFGTKGLLFPKGFPWKEFSKEENFSWYKHATCNKTKDKRTKENNLITT